MIKIFSFNTELNKVTGIQKVLVDIHEGLKDTYDAKIVGIFEYSKVNVNNKIQEEDYLRLTNPFIFKNNIVFIHERKLTTIFYFLNLLLRLNVKIVYVHHNEFWAGKRFTFLPKSIVSISNNGIKNLKEYFGVPPKNIIKIHNGIPDLGQNRKVVSTIQTPIKVLYAARVNGVKRQVEIVKELKNKLSKDIIIIFAGTGPQYEDLQQAAGDDTQFQIRGFVQDIPELIKECDYMLLYSTNEGLPITLIEGAMCGIPLITNDVGGNLEIAEPDENAFLVSDWDNLIETLNRLLEIDCSKYNDMASKSRLIYERKFQYEYMIERYLKLIESIVHSK